MCRTISGVAVLQAFERIWNQHDIGAIDAVYSDGYVIHDNHLPHLASGAQALKRRLQSYRTAFPDLHFTVTTVSASEEQVIVHWIANATHSGWYEGIAATGERVSAIGYTTYTVMGIVIQEVWVQWELVAAPAAVARLFNRRVPHS